MIELVVPDALAKNDAEWAARLPALAAEYLARWELTRTGRPLNGAASLILPVVRRDGVEAMLKLQPVNDESDGEALALRTWSHDDVVEVLEDDPATSTLLLERLEPRTLNDLPDHVEATRILAELLTRLMVGWDDLVATGDVAQAIRDRFDLMLEVTGIDRDRAYGWTAGRILQNVLWGAEDGESRMDAELRAVAGALIM